MVFKVSKSQQKQQKQLLKTPAFRKTPTFTVRTFRSTFSVQLLMTTWKLEGRKQKQLLRVALQDSCFSKSRNAL